MYSIGLDISKSTINVFIPINNLDIVIDNNINSIKSLYSKLKKLYKKEFPKLVFVYEPTGTYSFILTKFCASKNLHCFIVNPKKSANFAKVIGNRNKNDIEDARLLSQMIITARNEEIKIPIINDNVEAIKEAISCYKLIIKQQTQNKNHVSSLKVKGDSSYVIKELEIQYKFLKKQEERIIKKILTYFSKDKKLFQSFLNMQTMPGIGQISAIILIYHFIQYPDANQRQIVSLAGLDPVEKSSGTSVKGKAKISKAGSKICRGTLFMPVMVAVQKNERLKEFYNRLKDKGKHTTVAQIAVMRKMIVISHSLYKNNERFDVNKR